MTDRNTLEGHLELLKELRRPFEKDTPSDSLAFVQNKFRRIYADGWRINFTHPVIWRKLIVVHEPLSSLEGVFDVVTGSFDPWGRRSHSDSETANFAKEYGITVQE